MRLLIYLCFVLSSCVMPGHTSTSTASSTVIWSTTNAPPSSNPAPTTPAPTSTPAPTTTPTPPEPCVPKDMDKECQVLGNDVDKNPICKDNYINVTKVQFENLKTAFRASRILDLVILIDRSESIQCHQYQCAKDLTLRLIDYLSNMGLLVVGPDDAHVAIVTFGISTTVEYDGISGESQANKMTSCNIASKFTDSIPPSSDAGSRLSEALRKAVSIFKRGKVLRTNPQQILILVSDGEDTTEVTGEAAKLSNQIIEFDTLNVQRFAIGQNHGWMNAARENTLKQVVNYVTNYACRVHWFEALNYLTSNVELKDAVPIYVRSSWENSGDPVCDRDTCFMDCACEVTTKKYACVALPTTTRSPSTTPAPGHKDSGFPKWVWYAVGAGAALILALILIICCVCCRKRKEEVPKFYKGPDLPTPPVPRRRRDLNIMGYEPEYDNVNHMPNGDPRYVESPVAEEIQMNSIDVNQEMQEEEHDLPGWREYLFEEMHMKNLLHLGVHNMRKERWSMTPGIKVLRKEIKEASKLLQMDESRAKPKVDFKLAGNRYRLLLNECSEGCEVIATRKRKDLGNSEEEVAVLVREEHYIVVGIALIKEKDNLLASCRALSAHFLGVYGTAN